MCNIEISLLTLEIDDASGKTYLLLTNFDRKLTGEKRKKLNLNMETNISYQLVFVFDNFCEVLSTKHENMRFAKLNNPI